MMSFDDFDLSHVSLSEVRVRVRHGGSGPPLLLLHGYPQTHMMWGEIADDLARDFTVIAPDLRGYGGSSWPAAVADHGTMSKRAMGRDAVALMRHFGFSRFAVVGHDRGARVGYRLSLDHPDAVERLTVMDIIPTGDVWRMADARFALGYWHWSFLAQPHPIPEMMIELHPERFFMDAQFGGILRTFDGDAFADYLEAAQNPSVVAAICEDYRAGATFDRALDDADRGQRRIACPVQVLWGSRAAVGNWYDVLGVWRDWADDVRGLALDCGHFIAEERPAETVAALRSFLPRGAGARP